LPTPEWISVSRPAVGPTFSITRPAAARPQAGGPCRGSEQGEQHRPNDPHMLGRGARSVQKRRAFKICASHADLAESHFPNRRCGRLQEQYYYHLTNTIAASAAPARFPTSFDGLLTSIGGHSPGRHLGLLRVPSILRPLLRPTPRDAAVAGGAHGRGLPARRSCVRLHLRRRRAEPSACRRYALMRSISSRRSVWFTLNSSSGVAARRNAAPSHECADEASPAFPCVCRRGG
jgi:hypothetical protein